MPTLMLKSLHVNQAELVDVLFSAAKMQIAGIVLLVTQAVLFLLTQLTQDPMLSGCELTAQDA